VRSLVDRCRTTQAQIDMGARAAVPSRWTLPSSFVPRALVAVIAAFVCTPNTRAATPCCRTLSLPLARRWHRLPGIGSFSTRRHRSEPASPSWRCRLAWGHCQRNSDVCYTLMNRHRQLAWLCPVSARLRHRRDHVLTLPSGVGTDSVLTFDANHVITNTQHTSLTAADSISSSVEPERAPRQVPSVFERDALRRSESSISSSHGRQGCGD
jgi:hypothetical protein